MTNTVNNNPFQPNNFPAAQQQSNFDIKKYIFLLLSHWYLFAISLTIAYAYAYVKNMQTIPQYAVSTSIMVKDESGSGPESILGNFNVLNTNKNIQNEIGVLKSYNISNRALRKLDFEVSYYSVGKFRNTEIYKSSPFIIVMDSAVQQPYYVPLQLRILSDKEVVIESEDLKIQRTIRFGELFEEAGFRFYVELRTANNFKQEFTTGVYEFYLNNLHNLTNSYMTRLQVDPYADSPSILWLWIVGENPQKEVDYLNKVVEVYMNVSLEEKNQTAVRTMQFIDDQLEGIMDSLRVIEDDIQGFRQQYDIRPTGSGGANDTYRQLEMFEAQRSIKIINVKYYDYLTKELELGSDFTEIILPNILGVSDPILEANIQQIVSLYEDRKLKAFGVRQDVPVLQEIDYKIDLAKRTLKLHIQNIKGIANEGLAVINNKIEELNQKINELPYTERQMLNMEREYKFNDNIYSFLLQKRTEAGITRFSNRPDAKIIDEANAANAVSRTANPAGTRNKMLMIGTLIPLIFIALREFMNNKINDKSDIENNTQIPILGTISNNNKKTNLPTFDKPKSPISESFRALRTNLQYLLVEKTQKVIALTSTVSGEGKTFCAMNLASIIAMSDKKTLLVGLDLRKPKIHLEFDMENNDIGMSTYLIKKNTFAEIIKKTRIPNLDIAFSGPIPPNPAELIESDRMREFLEEAKTVYDFVIIDTPPVAIVTDALLLGPHVDAFLYNIRQNYTVKGALKLLNELSKANNLKNLSIIVNDVKVARQYGYRYGYGYGYGAGYGYGYGYGAGYGYSYGQGYYAEDDMEKETTLEKFIAFITRKKK